MLTFPELQRAVGKWSFDNFGLQDSKARKGQTLWELAPLMGIVEEMGEALESGEDRNLLKDAIGDATIYLLDFLSRESLEISVVLPFLTGNEHLWDHNDPFIAMGRLCKAVLKHHQGIRGMDNEEAYRAAVKEAVDKFLNGLNHIAFEMGCSILEVANQTWDQIVSKRDWKANPTTGETVNQQPTSRRRRRVG